MDDNLSEFKDFATDLAMRAGDIIRKNLVFGTKREWKSDHTPVTIVDKTINQFVIDAINTKYPEHSILSEEGSDLTRSKEFIWVCDPIDGTFPFMHGIPVSTFTLSLVKNGIPIVGVIYDPFMDRLFSAFKGGGATLNEKVIRPFPYQSLTNASIGVVFWRGNMDIFTPLLDKLVKADAKILDLCSIAYMDVLVAGGEFAATIFPGNSAHDSAAAKIIVEESGGVFTSLTGEVDRYDQPVHGHLACANQLVHDQIVSLLR